MVVVEHWCVSVNACVKCYFYACMVGGGGGGGKGHACSRSWNATRVSSIRARTVHTHTHANMLHTPSRINTILCAAAATRAPRTQTRASHLAEVSFQHIAPMRADMCTHYAGLARASPAAE